MPSIRTLTPGASAVSPGAAPAVNRYECMNDCRTCGVLFKTMNYHQWQCEKCDPSLLKHERRRTCDKKQAAKRKARKAVSA